MKLIDETVVKLAEAFQLPERIFKIDDLPWVPFDKNHTCYFKPLRFDLSTGTFIYEPPGDIHTLITEDEEVLTLFILGGALQYFNDNDEITGQDDIFTLLQKYKDFCAQNNIHENHELIY